MEGAICYAESLAKLDVQLDSVYRAYSKTLQAAEKDRLRAEQRKWLSQRDAACTIYKMWVDCLEKEYKDRIAELEKRIASK